MSLLNLLLSDGDEGTSRAHWVPDSKATFCTIVGCGKPFTFVDRRHHCRRCGEAVCSSHHGASIKLNADAIPDENGVEAKVCDDCFLTYQRRKIKSTEGEAVEEENYFGLPAFPETLVIPEAIQTSPQSSLYLASIITHLSEVFEYFNEVRKTLRRCNDSSLKRGYLLTEKARFDQTLNALLEHEMALSSVLPVVMVNDLSSYLQACLAEIEHIKEWAGSTEIYLLRSGKASLIRTIGMLPEEDLAVVEERLRGNERLAESLMSRLFEVTREEQEKLISTLQWVRARMDHDYKEYLLVPGTELRPFLQRLEKSIEYIDLYIDMCSGSLQYLDLEATIASFEQTFSALLTELEDETKVTDSSAVGTIKKTAVDLMRDLGVCKGLLLKSAESRIISKGRALEDRTPSIDGNVNLYQPLLNRLIELESGIIQLEEKIDQKINQPSGLPKENLHGKAAELYQTLQVQKARAQNDAIESEMFDL